MDHISKIKTYQSVPALITLVGLKLLDPSKLIQLPKLINYVKLHAKCGDTNKSPKILNATETKFDTVIC